MLSCSVIRTSFRATLVISVLGLATLACSGMGPAPLIPPVVDPDLVQRGAFLFRDLSVSADKSRSCDVCHKSGGSNGKAYRHGLEVRLGSEGARVVPPLRGVWQTAPYLWDGSMSTIEEVIDRMLEVEMGGSSLAGRDLEALRAYVLTIPVFDRGRLLADGMPTEPSTLRARRGFDVFLESGCDKCHPAPAFMRPLRFDVGTGGKWSVPTLRGVASSPPYGHDGRWATLGEAVDAILESRGVELDRERRAQLLEYLGLL